MEDVSLKSTSELHSKLNKMRKWRKPTYAQLMDFLHIYSELSIRNEV